MWTIISVCFRLLSKQAKPCWSFLKKLKPKEMKSGMAEMKLKFTRINNILYSVEWWDGTNFVFCNGCAGKRCRFNWPASKPLTTDTEYRQQESQAMNSVSCRRFHNFRCRYLQDVTDTNNLLSATGSENNDSHFHHPHWHTVRIKVTGHGAPLLKNAVRYESIWFQKNYVSCRILLRFQYN